ncbi:MAG: co-chaperone DjlA [Gammaproteobacteria bacterium]|jgi:DnaJ like chaperone protein|nr:co-chaperone DjlA [Gammaproteobacteria bacterium]
MSWWGKIFGGAFGFALGGPLGALLGAALGHRFDKGYDRFMLEGADTEADVERIQSAFFTATFSVMGHLAKSDGRVSEAEIQLAQSLMSQMQLNADQRQAAMHLFNQGKSPDFQLDDVLQQFKQECHRRRNLIQMFMEILIATCLADGLVHQAERNKLHYIGKHLGFAPFIIDQLIKMVQAQQEFAYEQGRPGAAPPRSTLKSAYQVLGVEENASDAEVKKAYRRLMNQHHPDKLVAKGLPEEMMKLATEKTQEIKKAYEQIKTARNF